MALSKEELDDIIPKIFAGDQRAFNILYKEYEAVFHKFTKKYFNRITTITYGMYQYEDIFQDFWMFFYKSLPKYSTNLSTMMTWLYYMLDHRGKRLVRDFSIKKRFLKDGYLYSAEESYYESGKGDEPITILSMLIDPTQTVDIDVLSEVQVYEYIYMLKNIMSEFTEKEILVYMHHLKGIQQDVSGDIIGISQVQVSRMRKKIFNRIIRVWENKPQYDYKEIINFANNLLSNTDPEELSIKLSVKFAVIKVCREILGLIDLYRTTPLNIPKHRNRKDANRCLTDMK